MLIVLIVLMCFGSVDSVEFVDRVCFDRDAVSIVSDHFDCGMR